MRRVLVLAAIAAALLAEYSKQIGMINRNLQFYLDSVELLK